MRKTKIVCTMGPACADVSTIRQLVRTGMNVARLNFAHGSFEDHSKMIERVREAARLEGEYVGIMIDIKGPEMRTCLVQNDAIELVEGETLWLTADESVMGTPERVAVNYPGLSQDVSVGATLLIDDGLIGLHVEAIDGTEIRCRVTNGGTLKNRKGINAPGVQIRLPGVTQRDVEHIAFAIEHDLDIIAASFVRKAADVLEIRRILEAHGRHMDIIAKIESQEGLDNLDAILAVSDGIMVARGDLGVEIPTEEVPIAQKLMIAQCNRAGKVVITATQMLDSMQRNPRPTRAEATDVANAIFDGTDAIMLSGETAAGKYPVESVATMAQIAERAERAICERQVKGRHRNEMERTQTDAISNAVRSIADELGASAIITSTESGFTARMVAKHRPQSTIVACTSHEDVARRLSLVWGVYPVLTKFAKTTDEMLAVAVDGALSSGHVTSGDVVVITAGVPVGERGTTNMLKIHTIGDIVARGTGIGGGGVSGRAVIGTEVADLLARVQEGDILVTTMTDLELIPAFEKAAAVVTQDGGITSHAAIVGLSLHKPVVVGAEGIMQAIEDGQVITVDAARGYVYRGVATVI
ncbi:MAG: pyruvate kinase [Firmicutes bacterium]|nr:pyruvate kinase [Bacillota bacterium]